MVGLSFADEGEAAAFNAAFVEKQASKQRKREGN